VLVLDELGYVPTLPGLGPALYELIAGRYERRPTVITSNKSLTVWAAIVRDASLAAALVDRICTTARQMCSMNCYLLSTKPVLRGLLTKGCGRKRWWDG
jgi:DNA replication protein DnaC